MGPLESLDDLVEELSLGSARGGSKRGQPVSIQVIRALGPEDLPVLQNPPPVGATPSIPEIRHQHHQIARLLAVGTPGSEISLITGFSPSYISVLKSAPDMVELVAYYGTQAEQRGIDALARLQALGLSSVEELQARINAEPGKFTVGQLTDLIEVGLIKPAEAMAKVKAIKAMGDAAARGGPTININFKGAVAKPEPGLVIEATAAE